MKIALVHKKYINHGGTELDMVNLSNFLANKGNDVHVFTSFWQEELAEANITFHRTPAWGKHLGIDKYIFAKNAYKEVQKYDFDIIQTFSRVGFGDVIRVGGGCHQVYIDELVQNTDNLIYKTKQRLKSKLSLSDYLTRSYEAKDFQPNNYKKIIAISQIVKDEIIANYHVPEEDIIINHNGVDINKFNPDNKRIYRDKIRQQHNLQNEDIVLLFVGTGFKRKGLEYILEAMNEIRGVKLLVVGKGKVSRYKKKAEKLGVLSRVVFVGASSKVEAYYAAADVFVFPTIYEPFGKVITEAMASGLPVITSRVAGGAEIIEHSIDGFILNNLDNIGELRSYITLLKDTELRRKMSNLARKKTLDYSEEQNHNKFLDIYQEILDE